MNMGGNALLPSDQFDSPLVLARQIDYYVSAARGNDLYTGSYEHPFATIAQAILAADESHNPGHNNIFVEAGTYFENLDINDDDPLVIRGMTDDPYQVQVNGQGNTVVDIHGGKHLTLQNMRFAWGSDGIFATDLRKLELENIVASDNSGSGLYTDNVRNVYLNNSRFLRNDLFGAQIIKSNLVRSLESRFISNGATGLGIRNANRVDIINNWANKNGDGNSPSQVNGIDTNNGLTLRGVGRANLIGGRFNDNRDHGVYIWANWRSSLTNVNASGNGQDGLRSWFYSEMEIRGGNYKNNGENGANIHTLNYTGNSNPARKLSIHGGSFSHNQWNGLNLVTLVGLIVFGLDVRNNGQNGLRVHSVNSFESYGGYFFANQWSGVVLTAVLAVHVFAMRSRFNLLNGLAIIGAVHIIVNSGLFWNNNRWGVLARGFSQNHLIQNAEFRNLSVLNNWGGLLLGWAAVGFFASGVFSRNRTHGLLIDSVLSSVFIALTVKFNLLYGMQFIVASILDDEVDAESPQAEPISSNGLTAPSTFEIISVLFIGGLFCNNRLDGIFLTIAASFIFGPILSVRAKGVVSRDNGGSGFRIDEQEEMYDFGALAIGHANHRPLKVNLQMNGGYYGHNGADGIYLIGANGNVNRQVLIEAKIIDVVAESNEQYGIVGSGAVDADSNNPIEVTRGAFNFNKLDGIRFNLNIDEFIDNIGEGDGNGNTPAAVRLTDVVANENGHNGLWVSTSSVPEEASIGTSSAQAFSEPSNQVFIEAKFIEVTRSSFVSNQWNGICFDHTGNNETMFRDFGVTLTDVFAVNNGTNGVTMNAGSTSTGLIAEITRGVFNRNRQDGVFASNFRSLRLLRFAEIIANDDDGVELLGIDFDDLDEAVIVANGDKNVERN